MHAGGPGPAKRPAFRPKQPGPISTLEGPDASVARVIEALSDTRYVHIACHGVPDRELPFKSGFPLHDAHYYLTVEIMRCDFARAQFAYLSACCTTVGDEGPDEVIHLAGAVRIAGFRSVIATMWAVEDKVAPKVTDLFYGDMVDEHGRLDHTRAAYVLNRTMRRVQGVQLDEWIVLVHIGA